MNPDAINEVMYVVQNRIGEAFGLASLRNIEEHILADRILFPVLFHMSQKGRRNTISKIMNDRYELWNIPDKPKKRNRVWNLQRKRGLE
ncbi:MAG TPA: hypothetical protein PLY78_11525 [Methanospirillum sp.]|nr:hypothetical protein [Methanospirillum sp.]